MNCAICSGTINQSYIKRNGVTLMRCLKCKFVFIPQQLYDTNPALQYLNDTTSPSAYYSTTATVDKKNFQRTLSRLEQYIAPGTILDIGASVGTFLDVAKKRGWHGIGIEPNPKAVAIARSKGLEMLQGFFNDQCLKELQKQFPSGFDAVHMGDIIEHVFEPLELLRLARAILKPGGYLAIVTPDIDTLLAKKYQIKPKEHLVYFNRSSMEEALNNGGFKKQIIKRQTKFRDIANIGKGTVYLDPLSRMISLIAKIKPIGLVINFIVSLFPEELLVIARKPGQN